LIDLRNWSRESFIGEANFSASASASARLRPKWRLDLELLAVPELVKQNMRCLARECPAATLEAITGLPVFVRHPG
jgi:hypothetical protein